MLNEYVGRQHWDLEMGITQMANSCPVTKWKLPEHYMYVASLVVAMCSLNVSKLNVSF